jgi:hypothetical protein
MEDELKRPDTKAILIASGHTGIVCPGECGCRLDDLKPCGAYAWDCEGLTGIPYGCQPGYAHSDPRGGPDWVVSTKKEPPHVEEFDRWLNNN